MGGVTKEGGSFAILRWEFKYKLGRLAGRGGKGLVVEHVGTFKEGLGD